MEERPISFNLLLKEELEYEVRIREAKPADKVVDLRAQVRALSREYPSDEIVTCDLNIEVELGIIQEKLACLDKLVTGVAGRRSSLKTLNRMQALAHHLFHRLGRLNGDEEEALVIESLQARLENKLQKLDNIMQVFKSSLCSPPMETVDGFSAAPTKTSNSNAVHKLNIQYDGRTCVKAFVQRLSELCYSRGINEETLFRGAAELFSGDALSWYRGVRDEIHSWQELQASLLSDHLPADYDARLMQEIRTRTQGPDESVINYLSVMSCLFARLSHPLAESDKLEIVLLNIRPFYTTQLALNPAQSWSDLKHKCKLLEVARERADRFREPSVVTDTCLAPDLGYKNNNAKTLKEYTPGVAAIQASTDGTFCVRCRVGGHNLSRCPSKRLVCFGCGEDGVTIQTCQKCRIGRNKSIIKKKN